MKVSLVSSTILFLATCLDFVSKTHGLVVSCCDQWSSTRVHADRIQGYYVQHSGPCPVRAIVFKTSSGKRICSDPDNAWTKSTMKKVDTRNRPNAGGLPTTAAPKTINAELLGTSAPPNTINAEGLGTSAPNTINAERLGTSAPPNTINAERLGTSAPPNTINAEGLGTFAPPNTINAERRITSAAPKTINAGWSYYYKTLLLYAIIYVFIYLI